MKSFGLIKATLLLDFCYPRVIERASIPSRLEFIFTKRYFMILNQNLVIILGEHDSLVKVRFS